MFVKIVIVLLLLIVAASLLAGRGGQDRPRPAARLRPLMLRVAVVLLALGAALAILHLTGCSRQEEAPFHATAIGTTDFARLDALDGLADHRGRRVASADFSGKAVIVYFGYTHCPDICPTNLAALKEAMRQLGAQADRVQVLFVTVDPERDTPDLLASYVPWFDPRFLGLSADPETTRNLAREFHVLYSKVKGSAALDYSIDHSTTSYAYDPRGRLRLLIRHGEAPENIAADLRRLLADK